VAFNHQVAVPAASSRLPVPGFNVFSKLVTVAQSDRAPYRTSLAIDLNSNTSLHGKPEVAGLNPASDTKLQHGGMLDALADGGQYRSAQTQKSVRLGRSVWFPGG